MHFHRILIVLSGMFTTCLAGELAAEQTLRVDDMVVVLIDAVNVPANESGVIAEFATREGQTVKAGQVLATLDDREAQLQESLASTQLEIARHKAEQGLVKELAEKKLAQQRQLAKQHEITQRVANKKAANEVRILASQKSEGVAKNELDRALRARQEFIDSVSRSEIDGLRLAYDRSKLETLQADFERDIDVLNAQLETETAVTHVLNIDRSRIEVAQAVAQQRVEQLQVNLQQHQAKLAELARSKHQIVSPLDGFVVERFRSQGDWVTAGEPVVRVIRLARLRAEGFVSSDLLGTLRKHPTVALRIRLGANEFVERDGKIVFVSPEIDPVNDQVRFWVEFDNPALDVLPGMRLNLRSQP